VQFVILGMLWGGPLSLYAVRQRFASVVSLFYSASFGSIQRALRILVDDGFASVADDPASARGARLYTVTDAGREAFRSWMRAPLTGSDLEQTMLAKVFFLGRLDDPAERAAVLAVIRGRIDAEAARLTALGDALPAALADDPLARPQLATLDYGRRSLALARTWITELEQAP
jgi:DNA-binding PadR family transcriptional regulator